MEKVKVLIADDDLLSLAILEMILRNEGIRQIDMAHNGMDALEFYEDALCHRPYDVVFLDIEMPVMDGLETLKQIRLIEDEADYRAMIIMATHDDSHETVLKTMGALDADDHIGKPYKRDEIHGALVSHGLVSSEGV